MSWKNICQTVGGYNKVPIRNALSCAATAGPFASNIAPLISHRKAEPDLIAPKPVLGSSKLGFSANSLHSLPSNPRGVSTQAAQAAQSSKHVELRYREPHRDSSSIKYPEADIIQAAHTRQTPISLQELFLFGQSAMTAEENDKMLVQAARWLHAELPVRLAHRAVELYNLPHGLSEMSSIKTVAKWYEQSFYEIRAMRRPETPEDEARFTKLITDIYERHGPTLVTMARGILELKQNKEIGYSETMRPEVENEIFGFLDTFYSSRIGIRTLIAQHVALHHPQEGFVGIIGKHCRPASVIHTAIDDASFMCRRTFGEAPGVVVYGNEDFSFPYIPSHLQHIMFELIKNSMRAVIEAHGDEPMTLPPVKVIVSAGDDNEDVVIKVSDEGGGIPRSGMRRIWSYFYTTYEPQFADGAAATDFSTDTPLAGLGYGLPLSRLYARYFGGDLQIISMEGYGTDAYVHLRRVGDAEEPLTGCRYL